MLRSMYSGISGMKNFQTKLDVIGNNIANVNTFGFKKGRVTFQDMVSQTISGASAASDNRGSVNPKQVGLGSQLATIETIDTQGSTQTTNRLLDVAIQGDGYFIVRDGTSIKFTRVGIFDFDETGRLITSSGQPVLSDIDGNDIEINLGQGIDPSNIKNLSIDQDGMIRFIVENETSGEDEVREIGPINLARFSNNGGLEKSGENMYIETAASGSPNVLNPGIAGAGKLISGALEMSNVDLSEEFTEMIVAQRGFQANSRIVTTSDEILQELVNLKR